jgi:uncharacterized protein (UPF0332 family)
VDIEYIEISWQRAVAAYGTAKGIERWDFDGAANRAYYAAFHAVSALFAFEETYFKKHTGVQSAVHKNLVHTGRWPNELGSDYDDLLKFRGVADYGAKDRATLEMACAAVGAARRILRAVHEANPEMFPLDIPPENPV